MEILDVFAHTDPRYGGVGPAAARLAVAIEARSSWRSSLVALCDRNETHRATSIPSTVQTIKSNVLRPFRDIAMRRELLNYVRGSSICHVHGLWLPHTIAARSLASRLGKPIVSSVHGMLERWELANKGAKKGLYSWLFERRSLALSSCLRALSEREAEDYRRYGLRNPIALIPTGIGVLARRSPDSMLARHPDLANKQVVTFMGRVHHKKGIVNLVDAWPQVQSRCPDAHLVVIGADYEGTTERLRAAILRLGCSNSITIVGPVSDDLKDSALGMSRCFALPSYSEGLSAAVLEALSVGVPVVITPECNIRDVQAAGAGFVTSNQPDALAYALISCLTQSDSQLNAMREAARKLVHDRYDWSGIAVKMQAVYEWLLGGPKPACVID
jgi:glycosyltransferase involved in cell wall biosynthesis